MKTTRSAAWRSQPARDRILSTAHDLFYADGIRATGIDRIIAEAGVTKVTFYRHFPSKNDLIVAFLDLRHRQWMTWFEQAVQRHGAGPQALVGAMAEWFSEPGFRGCAFLNSASEFGAALPQVLDIVRRHKQDVAAVVERLLPPGAHRQADAAALCIALDGAMARAAFAPAPSEALAALGRLVRAIQRSEPDRPASADVVRARARRPAKRNRDAAPR